MILLSSPQLFVWHAHQRKQLGVLYSLYLYLMCDIKGLYDSTTVSRGQRKGTWKWYLYRRAWDMKGFSRAYVTLSLSAIFMQQMAMDLRIVHAVRSAGVCHNTGFPTQYQLRCSPVSHTQPFNCEEWNMSTYSVGWIIKRIRASNQYSFDLDKTPWLTIWWKKISL